MALIPAAELTIDRLSQLGEGVGTHQGRTVFVQGALPGERVRVRLEPDGKVLRGELLEVLERSPQRRDPLSLCAVSDRCGGCDWLHLDEGAQRDAKREVVLSSLEHLGGVRRESLEVLPVLVSPQPFGYRRRAVLHFAGDRLAFYGRRSHEQVVVVRCPALVGPLAELPSGLVEAFGRI
ncbi:MAG TPA: TRAM domain-containing protein, partial [Myxococcaceae bacterium]|nr:TRAM domain-containing protein [Myxococcaceae bacterium]